MIRTARRNTSGPSISIVPPTSAWRMWRREPSDPRSQPSTRPGPAPRSSTTAPAPSPKRMAVDRSSQSTIRDMVSEPTSKHPLACPPGGTRRRPPARRRTPSRRRSGRRRRPGPRVPAAGRWPTLAWPRRGCRCTGGPGRGPRPASPARVRAFWAASTASPEVVPPTRRSRMPVRSTIHSSLVSRLPSRSALVTTLSGKALPHPVMRALDWSTEAIMQDRRPKRAIRRPWSSSRHAERSQATGWLLVSRSPATARSPLTVPRKGDRTSWPAT